MTTDEIFNYVMDDPEDTNPNVLKSLLNSMSSGGGSSVLVVTATLNADQTGTCDKTMGEIWTAAQTMPVILIENYAPVGIIGIAQAAIQYTDEPSYIVRGVNAMFHATSLDDYPSVGSGDGPHN